MLENFNMKEFLATKLNNGNSYWDFDKCGCIKGIAANVCNAMDDEEHVPKSSWVNQIRARVPRFGLALDIAEVILLSGYPQKAKLYLIHVVEKFNLLKDHPMGLHSFNEFWDEVAEAHYYKTFQPKFIKIVVPTKFCPELKKVRDTVKTTLAPANKDLVHI